MEQGQPTEPLHRCVGQQSKLNTQNTHTRARLHSKTMDPPPHTLHGFKRKGRQLKTHISTPHWEVYRNVCANNGEKLSWVTRLRMSGRAIGIYVAPQHEVRTSSHGHNACNMLQPGITCHTSRVPSLARVVRTISKSFPVAPQASCSPQPPYTLTALQTTRSSPCKA